MREKEEYDAISVTILANAIEIINARLDDLDRKIERIDEYLFKMAMEKKK